MSTKASKTYSLTAAASELGLHRNTLADWVTNRGCPAVTRADKQRGIDWELSLPDIVAWDRNRAVEQVLASFQDETGTITREEADRRRAVAQAITAEVAADEALDLVIARPEAEADMASFCLALKTGLSNASSRIASRAAMMATATQIQTLCEAELNRAFAAASAELAAKWDAAE